MNRRLAALAIAVAFLGACDLEEAERLDLTRGSSRSLKPLFRGLALDGSIDLPLTRVVSSSWDPQGGSHWSMSWIDLPPSGATFPSWRIVGLLDGVEVLLVDGSGTRGSRMEAAPVESWMERAGEVRLRVDSIETTNYSWQPWIPDLSQRIRDDRPAQMLERVFSFASGETLGRGDTVFVAVRNAGVNPVAVYSDFSGVRQIGAYELLVPPGARDTLRWLVTDATSDDRWIDLGWGDWGFHEKRSFRAP